MKERLPPNVPPSSEVFFKKKPRKFEDFEKAITYAEVVQEECMMTLMRIQKDVGDIDDYMLENGDKYESYRDIRNRVLMMMDKAEVYKKQIKQLEHDARTEAENPEGTVEA